MLIAFSIINLVKVGNDAKRGAPKNRNLLIALVEVDFTYKSFFTTMFKTT
jgi:hypothetical protein